MRGSRDLWLVGLAGLLAVAVIGLAAFARGPVKPVPPGLDDTTAAILSKQGILYRPAATLEIPWLAQQAMRLGVPLAVVGPFTTFSYPPHQVDQARAERVAIAGDNRQHVTGAVLGFVTNRQASGPGVCRAPVPSGCATLANELSWVVTTTSAAAVTVTVVDALSGAVTLRTLG